MALTASHHNSCQNRFKVVKIESKAPFRRGRWICMDFYDQPSHQEVNNEDQSSSNSSNTGSSIVAIDNKIEQAMDLVKSHLMFAVREEVDVLKEKITELMDKIARLEVENTILKSLSSPETLAKYTSQLQATTQMQQQTQQSHQPSLLNLQQNSHTICNLQAQNHHHTNNQSNLHHNQHAAIQQQVQQKHQINDHQQSFHQDTSHSSSQRLED